MTSDNAQAMADFARRRYRQTLRRIESDRQHRRQEQLDAEEALRNPDVRERNILRKLALLDGDDA